MVLTVLSVKALKLKWLRDLEIAIKLGGVTENIKKKKILIELNLHEQKHCMTEAAFFCVEFKWTDTQPINTTCENKGSKVTASVYISTADIC